MMILYIFINNWGGIMFPYKMDLNEFKGQNIQIQTYGRRIFRDQTIYEYLLEFLLIFVSPKKFNNVNRLADFKDQNPMDNVLSFPDPANSYQGELVYYPSPRIALKRFIFLNRSEITKRFYVDTDALSFHREVILNNIDNEDNNIDKNDLLDLLQDLMYGFNAIVKKRSWFAQSTLPVAPELIFCEAIAGNERKQHVEFDTDTDDFNKKKLVDSKFDFTERAFMARSGEVYFLHVLQGLKSKPHLFKSVNENLRGLVNIVPQLSQLANFIQNVWVKEYYGDFEESLDDRVSSIELKAKWIPSECEEISKCSIEELNCLLSSEIEPMDKLELLSSLIILQVIRMMVHIAGKKTGREKSLMWLVDLSEHSANPLRKAAVQSYANIEEALYTAVYEADLEAYLKKNPKMNEKMNEMKALTEANKDTSRLVRKIGKDVGLIVPLKGKNMRFAVNETIVRVLVASLIAPGTRMLLSSFLTKCNKHFNLVFGPDEYKEYDGISIDSSVLEDNHGKFQQMLKNCGFLRDLSDATSIVENPFRR